MFHLLINIFLNYKCLLENIHLDIKNYKIKFKKKKKKKKKKKGKLEKQI